MSGTFILGSDRTILTKFGFIKCQEHLFLFLFLYVHVIPLHLCFVWQTQCLLRVLSAL